MVVTPPSTDRTTTNAATNNTPLPPTPSGTQAPQGATSPLPLGMPPPHPAGQLSPEEAATINQQSKAASARTSQDPVEVSKVESQFGIGTLKGWQVLGELTNFSDKQVRKIELTTSLLDASGKTLAEQTDDLPPSLIPSNAGESKKFSITVKPPSGWQGKAAGRVARVEF